METKTIQGIAVYGGLASKTYSKKKPGKPDKIFYRNYRLKSKVECFLHYGNGTIQCNCCGERELDFLTIDHVSNTGSEHRLQILKERGNKLTTSATGQMFYHWLREKGYPQGFQVLCYNCNQAKHKNRICPHELYRSMRMFGD